MMLPLHKSSLVLPNNNPDSITYLNTSLPLSQAAILGRLRTLEAHLILTNSPLWLLSPSLRTPGLEGKGGYEPLQPIGHREATEKAERTVG